MSYILDALKKSEAERDDSPTAKPGAPTAFRAGGQQPVLKAPPQRHIGIWVALFLVILLVGLVALLLYAPPATNQRGVSDYTQYADRVLAEPGLLSSTEIESNVVNSRSGVSPKEVADTRLSSFAAPVVVDITPVEKEESTPRNNRSNFVNKTDGPAVKAAVSTASAVTDSKAPFDALESIPTLTITGHTYSSVREKRQVVMNNIVWREGDSVVVGVTLQEITQDGIILDVSGWPVVIGRSKGWKAIKGAN